MFECNFQDKDHRNGVSRRPPVTEEMHIPRLLSRMRLQTISQLHSRATITERKQEHFQEGTEKWPPIPAVLFVNNGWTFSSAIIEKINRCLESCGPLCVDVEDRTQDPRWTPRGPQGSSADLAVFHEKVTFYWPTNSIISNLSCRSWNAFPAYHKRDALQKH